MCVSNVRVLIHRGWGTLPEEGADYHWHLCGAAGGRHRLRGGLLQNQVRASIIRRCSLTKAATCTLLIVQAGKRMIRCALTSFTLAGVNVSRTFGQLKVQNIWKGNLFSLKYPNDTKLHSPLNSYRGSAREFAPLNTRGAHEGVVSITHVHTCPLFLCPPALVQALCLTFYTK